MKRVLTSTTLSLLLCNLLQSPVAADTALNYEWSASKYVVTPQLLGIASDGSKRSGVDQAAFIDAAGNLRLIFASYDEKKRSVISKDNGATWSIDTGFSWPTWSIDSGPAAYVAVSSAPEGGFRAFASYGEKGVVSATSKDGQVWSAESGVRYKPSDLGLQKVTSSNPIKLSDGTYRIYVGDDSDYFRKCASDKSITTNIYSLSSKDQLTWSVDPGVRVGATYDNRCKLHPQAFIDNDGQIGLIYHINTRIGENDPTHNSICTISKSSDGLTFGQPTRLPTGLPKEWENLPRKLLNCDDASFLVMPDKSVRVFFAVFGPPPMGDQIGMASGTKVSTASTPTATDKKITISCVKGKIVKKVTGANPKCPSGYKKR